MQKHKEVNRYKMSQRWQEKRTSIKKYYHDIAKLIVQDQQVGNQNVIKIICSMLFWAEGSKKINHIAFTNSDPGMIKTFIGLLRTSYTLDESKFHVSVHLHEYHNPNEVIEFWSKTTKIPRVQFIKPYCKPHTAIRKRHDYKGCITIRYYDVKIARELTAIYNAFGEQFRGVVQR